MRYTVLGFNQIKAIELGLSLEDLALLRYFKDFIAGGKMITKDIEGMRFYWFKYDNVAKEMPILTLKKDAIYRRLKALANKDILIHKTIKEGGTYSYYALGERFYELEKKVSNESSVNKMNKTKDKNINRGKVPDRTGYDKNLVEGTVLNPKQNNNILIDKYNKNSNTKITTINIENKEVYKLYSSCGNGLNDTIINTLDKYILDYSKDWVIDAIKESVLRGKANLRYIEGILNNWKLNKGKAYLRKGVVANGVNKSNYREGNNESDSKYILTNHIDINDMSKLW